MTVEPAVTVSVVVQVVAQLVGLNKQVIPEGGETQLNVTVRVLIISVAVTIIVLLCPSTIGKPFAGALLESEKSGGGGTFASTDTAPQRTAETLLALVTTDELPVLSIPAPQPLPALSIAFLKFPVPAVGVPEQPSGEPTKAIAKSFELDSVLVTVIKLVLPDQSVFEKVLPRVVMPEYSATSPTMKALDADIVKVNRVEETEPPAVVE